MNLSEVFRETERTLDNFITEGQIILSRAYEAELKAKTDRAFSRIGGDLVSEAFKFVGIPKKYTTPFTKPRLRIKSMVNEALRGTYGSWLNRLLDFLSKVSIYSESIKKPNSKRLADRIMSIDNRYANVETKANHIISYLNGLRNKSLIYNRVIPELPKKRRTVKRIPQATSVDILKHIRNGITDLDERVRKYVGRSETALGHLSEMAVKAYYESKGYEVEQSSPEVDQRCKVDLIATSSREALAIQVKKGQVSSQQITEFYKKASGFIHSDYRDYERKAVVLVASTFPENYLAIRDKVMRPEIDLQYLHSYQILRKIPKKYAYLMSENRN